MAVGRGQIVLGGEFAHMMGYGTSLKKLTEKDFLILENLKNKSLGSLARGYQQLSIHIKILYTDIFEDLREAIEIRRLPPSVILNKEKNKVAVTERIMTQLSHIECDAKEILSYCGSLRKELKEDIAIDKKIENVSLKNWRSQRFRPLGGEG